MLFSGELFHRRTVFELLTPEDDQYYDLFRTSREIRKI